MKALLLNATFQPLTVVSVQRAINLLMKEKAEIIHPNENIILHSENLEFMAPSVLKLRYFVKVPMYSNPPVTKRGIFARDGWECQYCGKPAENVDHIVPKSKGGEHIWENVVASCHPCNTKKGNRYLRDTGLKLRKKPKSPRGFNLFSPRNQPDWEQYLI